MPLNPDHHMVGRMSSASGVASFCECGLAFYAFDTHYTEATRTKAIEKADEKLVKHIEKMEEK